jgi:hypothetical protein
VDNAYSASALGPFGANLRTYHRGDGTPVRSSLKSNSAVEFETKIAVKKGVETFICLYNFLLETATVVISSHIL